METSATSAPPSDERLWSSRQIGVAAFLGSPLAAGWFFSRNYVVLGDKRRSRRALWTGLASTAGVIAVAYALPQSFPAALLPAVYAFAIERYAANRFYGAYLGSISKGGSRGSWWTVVGIGLASCAGSN